jgi:hypothetical protein
MRWDASPWTPWGLPWSERDGLPTLAEATMWELLARHPEVVRRAGNQTFLDLDRVYRVLEHPDRAYVSLVAVPESAREERTAAAGHPAVVPV